MQLGRSYSRRLKSVNHEINELWSSARYAYISIGPAVKTSRPLEFSMNGCGVSRFPRVGLSAVAFLDSQKELQQSLNP